MDYKHFDRLCGSASSSKDFMRLGELVAAELVLPSAEGFARIEQSLSKMKPSLPWQKGYVHALLDMVSANRAALVSSLNYQLASLANRSRDVPSRRLQNKRSVLISLKS